MPAVAVTLLVLANAGATRVVWRDRDARRSSRVAQTLLIWVVPALGAALAYCIHACLKRPPSQAGRGYDVESGVVPDEVI